MTQNLSANSLRVFSGREGTNIRSDSVGALELTLVSSSSEGVWYFFTEAGSPVNLDVGETLVAEMTIAFSQLNQEGTDLRFGIFDSKGTRTTENKTGGMNDASFGDDTAYGARFIPLGAAGAQPITITKRDTDTASIESPANPFNKSADFPAVTNAASGVADGVHVANDTDYEITYTLFRASEGTMDLEVRVTGGSLPSDYAFSATDNVELYTAFDCVGYRVAGNRIAAGFTVKRLAVDYIPAAPVITNQPTPETLSVAVGGEATFSVAASGNNLSYQWRKDGAAIDSNANASAATATLSLAGLALADSGTYTVEVSNGGGSVVSSGVALTVSSGTVEDPPLIATQPADLSVLRGASGSLSVVATGENLLYQWYKDETVLAGKTAATLAFASLSVDDMGTYSVRVSNGGGSVTSAEVAVVALSPVSVVETLPAIGPTWPVDVEFFLEFDREMTIGTAGIIEVRATNDDSVVAAIDVSIGPRSKSFGGRTMNYQPLILDGNTVQLTLHQDDALEYGASYYVTIDPGTFVDLDGAWFAGIEDSTTWRFSTRSAPPSVSATMLTVATDGSGDFQSIQGAIDHVLANNSTPITITVRDGVYTEIVNVPEGKDHITLQGESRTGTIIQYANNNNFNPDGTRYRASFGMDASDFTLQNLTIRNTTPRGGSQAEAFRTENDVERVHIRGVDFYSYQDTILAGGQVYFEDCFIFGDVDFLWGYGGVFLIETEIQTSYRSPVYYTQIRNPQGQPGYIFVDCDLTEDDTVTAHAPYAYLSRIDPANFPYSQVTLIDCAMGDHIRPEGWKLDNYTGSEDLSNLMFWEYRSTDHSGTLLDVSQRHAGSHQMSDQEATFWRNPLNAIGWAPSATPMLRSHPSDLSVRLGREAEISVEAAGDGPFTYRWFKDGTLLSGEDSASLVIASVAAGDAGAYSVEVSNTEGTSLSLAAVLEIDTEVDTYVLFAESYGLDPESASGGHDGDFDLDGVTNLVEFGLGGDPTVADPEILPSFELVSDTSGLHSLLRFDRRKPSSKAVVLANYSEDLVTWTSLETPEGHSTVTLGSIDDDFERVEVLTNLSYFDRFFAQVEVLYDLLPSIETQPIDTDVVPGGDLQLAVVASSTGGAITYQWFKDGAEIAGATTRSLVVDGVDVSNEGTYSARLSNNHGVVWSSSVVVRVTELPPAFAFELQGFATMGMLLTGGGEVDLENPESHYKVIDASTPNPAQTLENYLGSGAPLVIDLQVDVDVGVLANISNQPRTHPDLIQSGVARIDVASNKTLISSTGSSILHGSLRLDDASNVVIRNIRFEGLWEWDEATQGDYDLQGWDYIEVTGTGSHNVWIDHCEFEKVYDGQVDVVRGADRVTVSWCRFTGDVSGYVSTQIDALEAIYQSNPSSASITYYASLRGNGMSKEEIIAAEMPQKKSQLIGNSDSAGSTDAPGGLVRLNYTSHHNRHENVRDRGPRMRFGNAHVYNNYYDTGSVGVNSTMGAAVYVERTYFEEINTPLRFDAGQGGKVVAVESIDHDDGVVSSDLSAYFSSALGSFGFNTPSGFVWSDLSTLPYNYSVDAVDFTRNNPDEVGVINAASEVDAARLRFDLINW